MSLSDRLKMFRSLVAKPEDVDVFDVFVFPHAKVIYDSALRLCGNMDEAEDLMQETFFYAVKNFSQLKDHGKCKYWLFSILLNLFLKDVERGKRRTDMEFDLFTHNVCDVRQIESEYLKDEVEKNIRDILDKLDERLKRPIQLFYYDLLSYKEIAEVLNVPIGTVMSRIARGKVYLKKELVRSEHFRVEIERWLRHTGQCNKKLNAIGD